MREGTRLNKALYDDKLLVESSVDDDDNDWCLLSQEMF
jgi:hypothetical protein